MARIPAALVAMLLALAGSASAAAAVPDLASGPRAATAATAPSSRSASTSNRIATVTDLEQEVLAQINQLRRQRGLTTLRFSPELAAAARAHSRSMAEHGYFGHASYDGSEFWLRLSPLYTRVKGESWRVGENIVWASPKLSARLALELWMKSPAHRENLLEPGWREIGLGGVHALAAPGVYGKHDVTILTADFGAR